MYLPNTLRNPFNGESLTVNPVPRPPRPILRRLLPSAPPPPILSADSRQVKQWAELLLLVVGKGGEFTPG